MRSKDTMFVRYVECLYPDSPECVSVLFPINFSKLVRSKLLLFSQLIIIYRLLSDAV